MRRVYIAASFTDQLVVRDLAIFLRSENIRITSRWAGVSDNQLVEPLTHGSAKHLAGMDFDDIDVCDTLVYWNRSPSTGGGRDTEFGYAVAKGKKCIVLGLPSNNFHFVDEVDLANDWQQLRVLLSEADPQT